jgi:hypothetical protein
MDNAQGQITILPIVGRDDACRYKVVNLFERDLLFLQFFPERIQTLYAALYLDERHVVFFQPAFDGFEYVFERCFVFGPAGVDLGGKTIVFVRVKFLKRKILQLAPDLTHTEPVCDRGVNVERFLRDSCSLFRLEELHRPHVVQTVGEFDQDNANVRYHRQHHFADILGLLRLISGEIDVSALPAEPVAEAAD